MSKILALLFSLFAGYILHGQVLGIYANTTIPTIGGNAIIQPTKPPSGLSKSSVKVSGHFRGEVYIEPATGKIHVNNAYPNGDYKVDVFAPNGLSTSFTLTVAGTDCKYKGRFLFSSEISNIQSKSSRVADINQDGMSDLILLRQDIGGLTIMLNTKNGFEKNADLILGYVPESFDIGDLNNDGLVDIAVTNGPEQTIVIFYGAQNSAFHTPVSIQPKAKIVQGDFLIENPNKLITQDLNNDGLTDIIVFSSSQGVVFIGLGKTDNTWDFSQSVFLQNNNVKGDIEVADLSNDGFLEIIVEIADGGSMYIIGNLQNIFQILYVTGIQFGGGGLGNPKLEIFDVNADSNLDIYYTNGVSGSALYLGLGNNFFLPPEEFVLGPNNGGLYCKILDLNGDKFLDFFQYISPNFGFFGSIIGNGFISGTEYFDPVPVQEFSDISFLDINGDKLLDVCISDLFGSTSILFGTQNYFSEKTINPALTHNPGLGDPIGRKIIVKDITGDTFSDIIVPNQSAPSINIYKGNNVFGHDLFKTLDLPLINVEAGLRSIELGDLNNDGFDDLIVAMGSDSIFIYKGLGMGDFALLPNVHKFSNQLINSEVVKMHLIDYNRDGNMDIITLTQNSISLAIGDANFTFQNINSYFQNFINTPNSYGDVNGFEVNDINRDGFPELFVSDASANTLEIFSGNFKGEFIKVSQSSIGGITGFSIGDYNNDQLVDIIIGVPQTGLFLCEGPDYFDFSKSSIIRGNIDPYYFVGQDLDGDSLNELLYWNNGGYLEILFYDINRKQVIEQTTDIYSSTPGNIYFGDLGDVNGIVGDGNIDIYIGSNLGISKFLINESQKRGVFKNNLIVSDIVLCDSGYFTLNIPLSNVSKVQWEESIDNQSFIPILGQNSSVLNYKPSNTSSYVRANITDNAVCLSGNNSYSKTVKVNASSLYLNNLLEDLYSTCDSSISISIPSVYNNYLWSTGDSINNIIIRNSGKISVMVSDSLHCIRSDTAIVEMSFLNIVNTDTLLCSLTPITLHVDSVALKNNLYLNKLRNGLIFYAPMDSNTYDHTANFIHKTESGISFGLDRYGSPHKAVSFTAQQNNNIVYDYNKVLEQKSYTVSAWVKATEGKFWVRTPIIGFLGTTTFAETFAQSGIDAPDVITKDTWHHIVTVWDTTTLMHLLYVDGKKIDAGLGTSPTWSPPDVTDLFIGSHVLDANPRDFIGSIDDVAIWNRVLSPEEVNQLYTDNLDVVWSNGSIGNSITVTPTASTKYFASYTNGSTVCIDSVQVTVSVIDTTVAFSGSLPKCFGDSIALIVSEGNAYKWYKNDTLITSANSNIYKVIDTGNYRIFISDSFGCIDSTSKITVSDVIVSSRFSMNDTTQLLNGNNFIFKNLSTLSGIVGLNYEWDFGDGDSSTEESPIHKYNQAGYYKVTLRAASSNGCIDSTSLDITVSPGLAALFNVNDSIQCLVGNLFFFRDSSVVLGDSVSYLWEFGDGGTSSVQHPSYSYNRSGIYDVKLVIIGSIGNTDSIYLRIRVDSMPQSNFLVNDSLQCLSGNKYLFQNKTVVPNGESYKFKWDFGDGDTSLLLSPSHVYRSSGLYSVRLIGTSISGCSDTSGLNVEVFSAPVAVFSVNDTVQSFGSNRFVFSNLSKYSGGDAINFEWDFGDSTSSNEVSPVHVYDSVGTYRVKLLSTSAQGCVDSSFVDVNVFSVLDAGYVVNDSVQCLLGNIFDFKDMSTVDGGSMSYRWDFGDGGSSSVSNPKYSYSRAGLYDVKLLVIGSFGGIDSVVVRVRVDSMPEVSFNVNDTLQCLSGNSYLFSNTTNVRSGDSYSYKWDFGDGVTSDLVSPTHVYQSSGTYPVRLIGTSMEGCSDTSVLKVSVIAVPNANFIVNDTVQCLQGNRFLFKNLTPNNNILQFKWYFGDGTFSIEESPLHIFEKSGEYTVKLISGNFAGCNDTLSLKINVFSNPVSKFSVNDTLQCINTNFFKFFDSTKIPIGEKYSLNWYFGDGSTSINQNPIHTYRVPGSYVVKMVSSVSEGCTDSFYVNVNVTELPSFLKYEPIDVVSGIATKLQARKIGEKYLWIPSTGLTSPLVSDPIVNLKIEQRFIIKITTIAKCDVYDTLLVRVFNKYDIFVPQAFTPNNDGKNDRLSPFLVGIKSLHVFKIFDRWGNLIYNNSKVERSNGWDGKLNGKLAPIGAYVWIAEGVDLDNNIIKRRGNFALIR